MSPVLPCYDEANQLVREYNAIQNKSVKYIYDKGGNIVSKSIYAYNTTSEQLGTATDVISYTYDTVWKDKLTSYDGTTITYDEIGNPLEYGDKQYAWMGRELVGYGDENEDEYYFFQYNADGLRTLKREAYDTYENDFVYTWSDDGTLLGYSVNNEDPSEMDVDVWIIYDDNNEAVGFTATQKNVENPEHFVFYYVKNVQGDVIRVVDENGVTMVDYNYDAWGKFTITPGQNIWNAVVICMFNPVTYRGYYYDPDLGLYYLQSRYYNAEWGRFLNPDIFCDTSISALSTNMFSYCENNAVVNSDIDGLWKKDVHGISRDGTYGTKKWAMDNGFCEHFADEIAEGDTDMDVSYAPFPVVLKGWKKFSSTALMFIIYQKYHFNRSKFLHTVGDSRLNCSNDYLNRALNDWNDATTGEQKYAAAKTLGRALHCMQDYYSHGNIGVNSNFPITAHLPNVDKIDYVWSNSQKTLVRKIEPGEEKKRYEDTKDETNELIQFFLSNQSRAIECIDCQ